MTCVIAGKEKGYCWIAGDRRATWGDNYFKAPTKIFKKNDLLFGYAGSYKYGTVLWDALESLDFSEDFKFLEIQMVLSEQAKEYKVREDEGLEDVEMLLVYNNSIYVSIDNLHFIEVEEDYFGIGSGSHFALGALWSGKKLNKDLFGKELAHHALECSCVFSTSVGKPFDFLSSEPKAIKPRKKLEDLSILVQ